MSINVVKLKISCRGKSRSGRAVIVCNLFTCITDKCDEFVLEVHNSLFLVAFILTFHSALTL